MLHTLAGHPQVFARHEHLVQVDAHRLNRDQISEQVGSIGSVYPIL